MKKAEGGPGNRTPFFGAKKKAVMDYSITAFGGEEATRTLNALWAHHISNVAPYH